MYFIIIFLVISIVFTVVYISLISRRKSTAKKTIINELNLYGQTKENKKQIYDYLVDTEFCNYYVKVIYNFRNLEIALNSKNHWQLNDKVVSSKKSGTKIEGIYDLVNAKDLCADKPFKKIYLVYPSSKILVKAVNESELAFIHPNMDCYGVNIVKFNELDEIFKK